MARPEVKEPDEMIQVLRRYAREFAKQYPITARAIHDERELGTKLVGYLRHRRPGDLYAFSPNTNYDPHIATLLWPHVAKRIYPIFEAYGYFRVPATDQIREIHPDAKIVVMRESTPEDSQKYRELYAAIMEVVDDRASRAFGNFELGRGKTRRRLLDARAIAKLPDRKAA